MITKRTNEARLAAVYAHGNQTYDIFPYEKHLQDVVDVLEDANKSACELDGQTVLYEEDHFVAAWLHDVMEDGRLSYNDIRKHFGLKVAEMVYAVTDELGRNRKERKEKTYPKIRVLSDAVAIKLADRIANVELGIKIGNSISGMYLQENKEFRQQLFQPGFHEYLWNRLDRAVNSLVARENESVIRGAANRGISPAKKGNLK